MCPFQVVNPGHLEITQLNLEGHKPEESTRLEFFVPFTERDEENDIDDDYEVCGFTYWPCQICACMAAYIGLSQS